MNLFFPMLLVGLVTSVHCVTMCGTLVLSYAIKGDTGDSWRSRMMPHLAYQTAKIASYVVVGLVLGGIGAAFNLGGIRSWVMVLAGAFMVLMGLSMMKPFAFLRFIQPRPPRFMMTALMKLRRKANAEEAAGESSLLTPVLFGALTGLMPCAPLQSAQIAAAGAGSALSGATAMFAFGLGTMPLMLGFGAVAGMLSHKFKERMMAVAALVIVGVGLVMLNRGAMLVGSPVTFKSVQAWALGSPAGSVASVTTGKDGVAEVRLTIKNTQFVPSTVDVPAGRPVRLIVDRQEDVACSAQLAVPQLGVLTNLKAFGTTAVDLPSAKAGTYTLTCGMGMMSGRLVVGGTSPSGGNLPLLAVLALAAGAVGVALHRRNGSAAEAPEGRATPGEGRTARSTQPGGATVTVFGLSPPEVLIVGGALLAAVMAGLFFGGMFR